MNKILSSGSYSKLYVPTLTAGNFGWCWYVCECDLISVIDNGYSVNRLSNLQYSGKCPFLAQIQQYFIELYVTSLFSSVFGLT